MKRQVEPLPQQRAPRLQQMEYEKPQEIKGQVKPIPRQRHSRLPESEDRKQQEMDHLSEEVKRLSQQRVQSWQDVMSEKEVLENTIRVYGAENTRLAESEDRKQQEIDRLSEEVKRLTQDKDQMLQKSEDRKQQEIDRLSEEVKILSQQRDQSWQDVMSEKDVLKNKIRVYDAENTRLRQSEDGKQREIERLSQRLQESEQSERMLHRQMVERDIQFQEDLSDPLRPSAIATMFKEAQHLSLRVSQWLIDSSCQRGGDATAERVCAVPVFICELFQFIFDKAQGKATKWNNIVNQVLSSDGIIDICYQDDTKNQAVVVETSNRRPNIPTVDINASMRKDINKRDCKEFLPFLETAVKTYCINSSNTTNQEFFTQLQENSEFKEFLTEIFKLSLLMHLSTPPLKIQTKKVTFDKKLHDVSGRDCIEGIGIKYVWPALVSDTGVHVLGKVFTGNDFAKPYM